MTPSDRYQEYLSSLEGQAFQDEVCSRLGRVFRDFQPVPAKPSGDAGLDGLSHGLARAYCCYGPEKDRFKTSKARAGAVVKKFRADLQKLCEVTKTGKACVPRASTSLGTVLPAGVRLSEIYLIVTWFESKEIIGKLQASFAEYKNVSLGRFVDPAATLVIWGPKQFAGSWGVDEGTLLRMDQAALAARVRTTAAAQPLPPVTDFDAKFQWLEGQLPSMAAQIRAAAEKLKEDWKVALTLDDELATSAPGLHTLLEETREAVVRDSIFIQLDTHLPITALLIRLRTAFEDRLKVAFEERYGSFTATIAAGELGRLIGECPVDWRTSHA